MEKTNSSKIKVSNNKIEINYDNYSQYDSNNTTAQSENPLINKLLNFSENLPQEIRIESSQYSDYSFQNFVKKYQDSSINSGVSWNKEREYYLREQNNKKKIILKEINQFDFNDPLKILDDFYIKDTYHTNLLVNEMRDLDNIFFEKSYNNIIEKKGNLEMIKKIIEYYLNFVVEINFDSIMKSLKKLNLIEKNIELSYTKVLESKNKMNKIKEKVMIVSSKFLLLKQKLKNLLKIHQMIKEKLLNWWILFNQNEKLKDERKYCQLWSNLNKIRNEIQIWTNQNDNKNENNISNNTEKLFKRRSLIINDILLQKSKDELNDLQSCVEKQLNNIFYEKNENFIELYNYFMINPQHTNDKFFELIFSVYKKSLFNVIKGTLISFTEENKSYFIQDISKIKDITKLKFDENKFVDAINQLVKNLSKICRSYQTLIEITKSDTELNNIFMNKNNIFYEKIESKFSKILSHFNNFIKEFNFRNTIYIILYTCLFSEFIKFSFKNEYSKFLYLQAKNLILENIKFKNIQNIKKVGILLGGDNWKRVALQDYNEFFSQNKMSEKVSFSIRNFLTIFNDVSLYVNKKNIQEVFTKYLEIFNTNNKDYFLDDIKLNFAILSKKLNNKTIILSSSTITLINYFVDLILYLLIFDNITFEIFSQIFNLIDYYILAALKMFVDKKYFSTLFEEINIEETKKKNKYENTVDTVLFQKIFSNLRSFLSQTKKNLEVLFEVEIDLVKSQFDNLENYESNDFYLPKINSQIIINDNNIYSCMIESIILYESLISICKILKRISHFSKKIELEFQINYINENIKKYEIVLDEIKVFIYKPICSSIFKIDPILNKISQYKWDPNEIESENEFSEANVFIDNLFQEICEKYDKLYLLSGGSLTEKSQLRFLDVILVHINEKLMEVLSKIKKCNSTGRSIMLKDIKFLKSKIENKFGKDVNRYFGQLELYINSWYCTEDEFIKYIEDTHLNYKFLNGILNTGQNFTKLTRQQKKDFNLRIDETYLNVIDNIKISMLD